MAAESPWPRTDMVPKGQDMNYGSVSAGTLLFLDFFLFVCFLDMKRGSLTKYISPKRESQKEEV